MIANARRQQGFALLLTLVLLMIAAVALSHVARQSASEAIQVQSQTEALQRRWAMTSCRATLLPRAKGLLAKAARGETIGNTLTTKPGELWISCELAGQSYDLVFTDEQTKYNPTAMDALKFNSQDLVKPLQLHAAVRGLTGLDLDQARQTGMSVNLQPMIGVDAEGNTIEGIKDIDDLPGVYASFGQLFTGVSPEALVGTPGQPGLASKVTCWGDGRINLENTSMDVVQRVLSPVLTSEGVRQVLIARAEAPEVEPVKWIDAAVLATPEQRRLAQALLTEQSSTQGLWVIARGKTRSWYSLSVRVFTPLAELEAVREEQAKGLSPAEREELADKPLPDPVQRYDFNW